jgi:ssDNA-binding replication factor A large subunit
MSEYLLREKTNPLREFSGKLSSMGTLTQEAKSNSHKIGDLRAGMKHLNLAAEVLEVSQPIQIVTRFGNYANMINALIADETGTIKLSLLGSQIKMVSVHDALQIENAHVAWFRGERQLRIGKHGKINVIQRSIYA